MLWAVPPALALVVVLVVLTGCGEPAAPVPAQNADVAPAYAKALAALSPEDQALAAKQKVCPVMDSPLGSMGTPMKVTVEGRDVLLCCAHCQPAIEADPQKFLDKLSD
jgi:hypothetical protein